MMAAAAAAAVAATAAAVVRRAIPVSAAAAAAAACSRTRRGRVAARAATVATSSATRAVVAAPWLVGWRVLRLALARPTTRATAGSSSPRLLCLLCLLPLLARPRHGDSREKGERSVCVSSLRQHAASGRAAGRPGSCRRSSFPVGGTALTRRARARRAWWAHLRRGATCGCGHIARSLLFGRQKPWSLSQISDRQISFPLPTHLAFG